MAKKEAKANQLAAAKAARDQSQALVAQCEQALRDTDARLEEAKKAIAAVDAKPGDLALPDILQRENSRRAVARLESQREELVADLQAAHATRDTTDLALLEAELVGTEEQVAALDAEMTSVAGAAADKLYALLHQLQDAITQANSLDQSIRLSRGESYSPAVASGDRGSRWGLAASRKHGGIWDVAAEVGKLLESARLDQARREQQERDLQAQANLTPEDWAEARRALSGPTSAVIPEAPCTDVLPRAPIP